MSGILGEPSGVPATVGLHNLHIVVSG